MNRISLIGILERLKAITNSQSDSELARTLGISAQTLSTWKVRNSIPYKMLLELALNRGLSLDWLLLGEGEQQRAASPSPATPTQPWEAELLDAVRRLAPADVQTVHTYAQDKLRLQQLEFQLNELRRLHCGH